MGLIKQQNGSVALVMVVVLMTMGLILIKSLHFYQERAFEEWRKEVRYFSGFNRAESALAWGLHYCGISIHVTIKLGFASKIQTGNGKVA